MTTLKNTKDNNARVTALKSVKETDWTGNIKHTNLEAALTAVNLFQGVNSGHYTPVPIKIKGLTGIFMINENGGLNFESRIIKETNESFVIEHLSSNGYNTFERKYTETINS